MRTLIIVESPNKIATIKRILKELNYSNVFVYASAGHISHIADTGDYNLGINLDNFDCKFEIDKDKKEIVKTLKEQVKLADKIILATDGDREGEAIAWSLKKFLGIKDYERITYHELTKEAFKKALDNPVKIDDNLVEAAHTRSKLDKIVGYRLSPIASKKLGARSVGRCQSAGLKLVVDREKEIQKFVPEDYYELYLNFNKEDSSYPFRAKYTYVGEDKKDTTRIPSKEEVEKIKKDCEGKEYKVSNITTKETYQSSPLPFITSTYQQEVSSKLGLSISLAMSYAQRLFEGIEVNGEHIALVTYIRTDDATLAPEFVDTLKDFIITNYGKEYYIGLKETKKKDNVQAGHEGIRCIDLNMTPKKLSEYIKDERLVKVYEIIYRRTLACVMSNRKLRDTTYTITNGEHRFIINSKEETFDGWKKVYTYEEDKEEVVKETLTKNDKLVNTELEDIAKQTQPPSRYTEATLDHALEKAGIGRPATYQTIVDTLKDEKRNYCKVEDKKLVPTNLGIDLVDFLDKYFNDIVDSGYTANLEKSLDEIAEGNLKSTEFLKGFYNGLKEEVEEIGDITTTNKVCPECGGKLVVRKGKYGQFLGCSNYPNCKYIEKV